MNRYVAKFAASYLVLIVLLTGVMEILKLSGGTSFAVASVLGASFFASAAFAKNHGRAPTREEKAAFAWRALLCEWLVSLLCSIALIALQVPASELGTALRRFTSGNMLALGSYIFVFVFVLRYVAIRWSFGWYAGLAARGETREREPTLRALPDPPVSGNAPVKRASRLPGAGLIASVAWSVAVIALTVHTYVKAPSFQEALSGPCPLLSNQLLPSIEPGLYAFHPSLQLPIVIWWDRKTQTPISLFFPSEQANSCVILQQRARLQLELQRSGATKPELHVMYVRLAALALAPMAFFALLFLLMKRRPE